MTLISPQGETIKSHGGEGVVGYPRVERCGIIIFRNDVSEKKVATGLRVRG